MQFAGAVLQGRTRQMRALPHVSDLRLPCLIHHPLMPRALVLACSPPDRSHSSGGWSRPEEVIVSYADADEWREALAYAQGRLVTVASEVDFQLGTVLVRYFGVSELRNFSFRATLLAKLSLATKIEAIRVVLRETNLLETHKELLEELARFGRWRNIAAHSLAGETDGSLTDGNVGFLTATGGQIRVVRVTVPLLHELAERGKELSRQIRVDLLSDVGNVPENWHPAQRRIVAPLVDEPTDDLRDVD
jgi:hypothetical protein